jgi:methyl coenzyme M reductase subunit C
MNITKIAVIGIGFLFNLCACATEPVKKAEKPTPIIVTEVPKMLASIDQETLKVTYSKGADPKLVVDQVVKAWAEAIRGLNACEAKVKDLEKKIKVD